MRKITGFILCLLLLMPVSALSLDLDAINLYPNIIKSLQSQEKGWYLHGDDLVFAKPKDIKGLKKVIYAEYDMRSIVVMSYSLFHNGGYISMDKPVSEFVRGRQGEEILEEIKILVMEKLYKDGIRRRSEIKKRKVIEKAPESKSVKSGELVKFEAEGRKL